MLGLKGVAQIHFSMKKKFSQKVFWAWVSTELCWQRVCYGEAEREGGGRVGGGTEGTVDRELRVDTQTEARETQQTKNGHL